MGLESSFMSTAAQARPTHFWDLLLVFSATDLKSAVIAGFKKAENVDPILAGTSPGRGSGQCA